MLISTKSRFRLSLNKLEVPTQTQYTNSMKNNDTYTDKHLTADLAFALEGYMDINDVPFRYEGTFKEMGTLTDNEGIVVTVNNRRFQIKVIPA